MIYELIKSKKMVAQNRLKRLWNKFLSCKTFETLFCKIRFFLLIVLLKSKIKKWASIIFK